MLLRIVVLFSLRYTTILAEEFIACNVTDDCVGLRYCDPEWGCITEWDIVMQIILGCFGVLLLIGLFVCVWMWIRCKLRDRYFASAEEVAVSIRLNNYYLTQSVMGIHVGHRNLMTSSDSSTADNSEPAHPDEMHCVANTSNNVTEVATSAV